VPLVVIIARARRWAPDGLSRLALVAVGATLFTHPLLWAVLGDTRDLPIVVFAELVVTALEAAAYAWGAGLGARRGIAISLLANGASFMAGLVIATAS